MLRVGEKGETVSQAQCIHEGHPDLHRIPLHGHRKRSRDHGIGTFSLYKAFAHIQIGNEPKYRTYFNQSIEEAHELGIFTQQQALKWVGSLVSMRKGRWSRKRSAEEEGREVFNTTILCHVPVVRYDFWPKCVYLAYMTRECLQCIFDHSLLSDKDYYGNKRIETAGDLMSLLFEDLFKMYNAKVKEFVNKSLQKVALAKRVNE